MTRLIAQSLVIDDFEHLKQQMSAFDILDSAIAIFDHNKQCIYQNPAFNQLNTELRDSPERLDAVHYLLDCQGVIETLNNTLKEKSQTLYIQRFYYDRNIHVDLTLCFTPIYDNKHDFIHGILCSIGEEAINFNGRHLAKLQDKLSTTKERIKRLEKEKINNETLIKHLFKHAPFAMVLLNSDRTLLHVNRHAEQLFNVSSIDMIGKPCQSILNCYDTCNNCPIQVHDEKKIELDEITGHNASSNNIPLLRSGVQFDNMDSEIILEAFIDLRETKKAQQENKAKTTFLANMTHEIRTPLTSILGYSEMLLDNNQSIDEHKDSIHTIIRNGRYLQQLINNILDISKIEAERLDVESIDVSIFELVKEIRSIIISQAKAKGIDCYLDFHYPLPETIYTDPIRLRQILMNLCSNAIKFTHTGHTRLHISYVQHEEKLYLKVIDTGIGIPADQLHNIFENFTQADPSTTREYGGSGLGLHLSRQLAQLLGGDITVESQPGKGSCFTLSIAVGDASNLNLIEKEPEYLKITEPAISYPDKKTVSGRILLAEDNADNQDLISLYIKKVGADVDIANNGQEAVNMAMKKPYDLIFMDMQMPIMDGMEAAKTLRSKNYDGPIVALTANAFHEFSDKCKDAGCCGFLSKPIDREHFYRVIYQHLKQPTHDIKPLRSSLLDEEPELIELIEKYIDKYPDMIHELKQAFHEENWELFNHLLHDLKSTGGNYGFMKVTDISMLIKQCLDNQEHSAIQPYLAELEQLHPRMILAHK